MNAKHIVLKPLGKRLLAKVQKEERVTQGGIILPNNEDASDFVRATVVSVSEQIQSTESMIREGSDILIDKFALNKVLIDDDEFVIVNLDSVAAICKQ